MASHSTRTRAGPGKATKTTKASKQQQPNPLVEAAGACIDLTTGDHAGNVCTCMDIDVQPSLAAQDQLQQIAVPPKQHQCSADTHAGNGAARPGPPVAPGSGVNLTDAQHAIDYLTSRCVSCRGPAVEGMKLRPVLQQLADQLTSALHGMVRDATSFSALVLGDPGSGKTLLVERAISSVCTAHNLPGCACVVGVVRLSGLLHTDERSTFQDIARQLCSEFGQEFSKAATFDENLAFLRAMLATLHRNCQSVVFQLDAFERFARARGKQQLLYNLLDVLQHAKVQAAVIGVTCAQDVMESMEKRVRSRFSHRRMMVTGLLHFDVPTPAAVAAASTAATGRRVTDNELQNISFADTPCGVLQDMLTLPHNSSSRAQQGTAIGSSSMAVDTNMAAAQPELHGCCTAYVQHHNSAVAKAVVDKQVKDQLRQLFVCGIKPRTLAAVARTALDALEEECLQHHHNGSAHATDTAAGPLLGRAHLLAGIQSQMPQPLASALLDLSVLQLYLAVGMARLEGKGQQVYNFEMIWDECQSYRDDRSVLHGFTHDAAWRAFEELVAQNVAYWISPGAEAAGRAMRYAGASLSVGVADVQAALQQHAQCPNELHKFMNLEA